MRNINWSEHESKYDSAGGKRLPAGVYVAKITAANDNEEREYVELIYDIAEGEFKGYYDDTFGKDNTWAHRIILS